MPQTIDLDQQQRQAATNDKRCDRELDAEETCDEQTRTAQDRETEEQIMPRTAQAEPIERESKGDRTGRQNNSRDRNWTKQQFNRFDRLEDLRVVEQFRHDAKTPAKIAREARKKAECGSRDVGRDGSGADQAGTRGQELEARLEGVKVVAGRVKPEAAKRIIQWPSLLNLRSSWGSLEAF